GDDCGDGAPVKRREVNGEAAGARRRKIQALAVGRPRGLDIYLRVRGDDALVAAVGGNYANFQIPVDIFAEREEAAVRAPRGFEVIAGTLCQRNRGAALGRNFPDVAAEGNGRPVPIRTPTRRKRAGRGPREKVCLSADPVASRRREAEHVPRLILSAGGGERGQNANTGLGS